jgi:proline dehydrogenase
MPIPDFNDTLHAFSAKDNAQLKTSLWLFRMIDSPLLATWGPKMMNMAFSLGLPIESLVKKTLFQQFCGGSSLEDTIPTSQKLFQYGVKTILDYSVEGEKTEAGFDATGKEIIATLVHGGKNEAVEKIRARLDAICQAAVANDTPVFIDAEESWIQTTIDELAEEMMEKYNSDKPLIYTTVQLYRHDRLQYLRELIRRSKSNNYFLGVKLVRGAYMEKEGEHAAEIGYPNPIQLNKAATDSDYDAASTLCLDNIEHVAICLGTHNEESSRMIAALLEERNIPHNHPFILFAQLYGMSDHISFNLAHNGYNVAKYLPYGPVKAVMPYLMRRANENTSIAGQTGRELLLLKQEMKRRKG